MEIEIQLATAEIQDTFAKSTSPEPPYNRQQSMESDLMEPLDTGQIFNDSDAPLSASILTDTDEPLEKERCSLEEYISF
jgi:hypothetical protein